jgi:hypothetical protein
MNITEFEQRIRIVLKELGDQLGRTVNLGKRQLYAERARKQILKIVKEARRKLDKSKVGLKGRWFSDFVLSHGPFDHSPLPNRLQQAKDQALTQVQKLVSGRSANGTKPR